MNEAQVRAMKANLTNAEKSGDVKVMVSALCVGLIENAECAAHSGERVKTIEQLCVNIQQTLGNISTVLANRSSLDADIEKRLATLERWKLSLEQRGVGASMLAKVLIGAGLVAGGSLIPTIIKALLAVYGGAQ